MAADPRVAESPTVVGINRTQDGAVAVVRPPAVAYSLQKERVSRRKHHWGRRGDVERLYAPALAQLHEPVDLVVECYSSDAEIEHLADYRRELESVLTFREAPRVLRISHHLSHLYSAFPPSPFDRAAVMVIDAQGSRACDITEPWPGQDDIEPDQLECASFYECGPDGVRCLDKQFWNGDPATPAGLGSFYYQLTRLIFPGEGNEGKVMGMAPFGDPHALGLPPLSVRGCHVLIPPEWTAVFQAADPRWAFAGGVFEDAADLAAAGQLAFEEALLAVADRLHELTGARSLCFAGGTGLNCSANGRLIRESRYADVFVPPSPHDGGTALGCALYGLTEVLGVQSDFQWTNDFLGPDPDPAAVAELVAALPPELVAEQPADLAGRIVELLAGGRVVGLHQGRSESGPRALGNRSILADARRPGMQDYINTRVKGREWFRPLAPLVLAEVAGKVFDVDRPAPFMQYAADVRPEYEAWLPAITHVDGTARLQTVEEVNTPFLYELLRRFEARTGCPVLLNTSLNGPGQPLVESPADSLETLRTTDLHALALPPYLIRKRDEPPVPA